MGVRGASSGAEGPSLKTTPTKEDASVEGERSAGATAREGSRGRQADGGASVRAGTSGGVATVPSSFELVLVDREGEGRAAAGRTWA